MGSKAGVKVDINAVVAKGHATLTAEKDHEKGKHDLYIDLDLNVKGVGKVNSKGKYRLLTLPYVFLVRNVSKANDGVMHDRF